MYRMTTPEEAFGQPSESRTTVDPEGDNAAYTYDGKPDRWKRYRLPDPVTGEAGGWTRSTTFAKSISDTYVLSQWGTRMAMQGLIMADDLYAAAAATPFEDKEAWNKLADQAKEKAGAKTGANIGTALHAFTEQVDQGEKPLVPPKWRPHVAAWTELLHRYNMEVIEIEKRVLHHAYGVAGTLDRLVRFTEDTQVKVGTGRKPRYHTFKKGTVACLDLKTGRTLEYGWMEIAVQLLIYTDAPYLFDQPGGPGTDWSWRSMYPEIDKDIALVIHIPAVVEEAKATLYALDLNFGRETAALCEQVRNARKRRNVAVALDVVEELPATAGDTIVVSSERADAPLALPGRAMEVRPPTLMERTTAAVTPAELSSIWFTALRSRQDTPELMEAISKRRGQLLAETAAG
jgi:hypothetical protein